MSEMLLRSARRLTGAHRVTATVRPIRLAYLVDPTEPGQALAAIDACSLLWGGPHQVLIPCMPSKAPDAFWNTFLEHHDPDELIDLVGADPAFLEIQKRARFRLASRWTNPTETMLPEGTLLLSILRNMLDRGRWNRTFAILNIHPLFGHPLALPLAYRVGHLERRPMNHNDPRRSHYIEYRLEDVAQLNVVNPSSIPLDALVQVITENPLPVSTPERPGYIGLPSYRVIDIAQTFVTGVSRRLPMDPPSEDDRKYGDRFMHQMVVVGSSESVIDMCLAWNLHALRPLSSEPIWINKDWITDPAVLERLEKSRRNNKAGPKGSSYPGEEWLGFISASLPYDETVELAASVPHAVAHRSSTLSDLLPDQVTIGPSRRSTAVFLNGIADVPLPDVTEVGHFGQFETLGVTVSIPGWHLPRLPKPKFGSTSDVVRVARDGLVGELRYVGSSDADLVTVNARNGQEAVDAVAAAAGFSARVSDKGKLAIAVLDLFGSQQALSLLSSSNVYALLNTMATGIVSRQAVQSALRRHAPQLNNEVTVEAVRETLEQGLASDGQFDRQHFTGDQIRKHLKVSNDDANWILSFMVQRGIVFRGFELQCQNCGLTRWILIDRMAADYTCDGCLTTSPTPLNNDVLQWRYRLNELVAQGVDQGVLPHLLAVRHLTTQYRGRDSALLGLLPGVDFLPLDQLASSGRQQGEADLVAIVDGRMLLAECKRSGSELRDDDIDKTLWLASQFDNSIAVFATPTDFSKASDAVDYLERNRTNAIVEMWEGRDLLDPQSDASEYLSDLVDWLRGRFSDTQGV